MVVVNDRDTKLNIVENIKIWQSMVEVGGGDRKKKKRGLSVVIVICMKQSRGGCLPILKI